MTRILIAEDDDAIRAMEERILVTAGYEVVVAADGELALETLNGDDELPALAILDVMMPVLSGFELARKMQEDDRLADIPVIFVTAKSDAESMNEGFRSGGTLYLSKPFTTQKLLAMVKAVVGA